jgi:hypothetical protein
MPDSTERAGLRDEAPRKQNRSPEELAMRDAVEAWGRQRWPDARVVHELVTGECRIDMAFVRPDHLIGVEIKSSKDTLDRLEAQLATFTRSLPEVWLAMAPRWRDAGWSFFRHPGRYMPVVVDLDAVEPIPHVQMTWGTTARPDRGITADMLHLLWLNEMLSIAVRRGLHNGKGRSTRDGLRWLLARALTGDEIVSEVCRELRSRDAFWRADPPVRMSEGALSQPVSRARAAGIPVNEAGGGDVG